MDLKLKLAILADAAKYDASCAPSGSHRKRQISGIGNKIKAMKKELPVRHWRTLPEAALIPELIREANKS